MSAPHPGPLVAAGVCLGAGLGGFFDGILLHQILQWHSMISSVRPPVDVVSMKVNMLWDGVFHAFAWVTTVVGVGLLFRAARMPGVPLSTRTLLGGAALGFGSFNLIEGAVDHQILGIHHVHPGANQLAWDLGFLLSGVLLICLGWLLIQRGQTDRSRVSSFGAPAPRR